MTESGEKGLGVLLAESVQQGNRPVSRELVPLPIPFPENEHVESERLRSLSRAGLGGRKSAVFASSHIFISNLQCFSGDKRCRVQFCRGSLDTSDMGLNRQLSRRVSISCPTHVRTWQMVLPF